MNLTHLHLTLVSTTSRNAPTTPRHRATRPPLHDIAQCATTPTPCPSLPSAIPTPLSPLTLPFSTVVFPLQIRTTARRLMFCGAALVGGGILYFAVSVGQDQMGPPNTVRSLGKVVGDGKRHVLQPALQHELQHALRSRHTSRLRIVITHRDYAS